MDVREKLSKIGQEQLLKYESELTEEQKAKIAACETPDYLLALAREACY